MPEQIAKLTPSRDLQGYFFTPSAIAALSSASSTGFVFSGKWRQQLDWAVVEWNRDNVFEHPSLRYLPDGDLSGLLLSYQEQRGGCIPLQSNLYPLVEWDRLRLWVTNDDGTDTIWYVSLTANATAITGSAQAASATMTLMTAPPAGSRIGLAFLEEHYYYIVADGDSLSQIAAGVAAAVTSSNFIASSSNESVTITCKGTEGNGPLDGANGNRLSMYGFSEQAGVFWHSPSASFSGGVFPTEYQVVLNFGNLMGTTDPSLITSATQLCQVPTTNVRKMRWTWAADLQNNAFNQTEFQTTLSNWTVTGTNQLYNVAGPGSRRIEDTGDGVAFQGNWSASTGNYSGSKIHQTSNAGDTCTISYSETATHQLYLGLRRTGSAPVIRVSIDGGTPQTTTLTLAGEDVLIRFPLGSIPAGSHTVVLTHSGQSGQTLYFDFLEIAYPSNNLPDLPSNSELALATDWDTYHSQSLPAERTAWLIQKLGFTGRVNHYVGALWFYEIVRTGTQYATLTVQFDLISGLTSPYVQFALAADPTSPATYLSHLVLPDDTSATVALAIAEQINAGANLVWASVNGDNLTLTARAMGIEGNNIFFELYATTSAFSVSAPSNLLSGGVDGTPYALVDDSQGLAYNSTYMNNAQFWRTDLTAIPRINRAARDWHAAYFSALKDYGMDAVASFSTELGNGDPSATVGIAQRYFDGTPVVLNTPAIQTNFSPTSVAYWQAVYLEMAAIQSAAGLVPYLQSGEVQWWYFASTNVSMPFYDAYTQQQFQAQYGVAMQDILTNTADPSPYPNEVAFLPTLIGAYTFTIRTALQTAYPQCRFEVLYPTDTNDTSLNSLINYPSTDWTPANLTCLKTESFTFTGNYDLVSCTLSMNTSAAKGFPNPQRAHLIGISDAWSAWLKEADIAQSEGLETIVLFALDQYCLIGYPPPPFLNSTRSSRQG